jgi:hypothetical protein
MVKKNLSLEGVLWCDSIINSLKK